MAGERFQAAADRLEGREQRSKQAEQARELSGFAAAQQLSQDQAQVVSGDSQVGLFAVVFQASQLCAATAAGFADVGEAAFDPLAALLLQLFVPLTGQTSSVGPVRVLIAVRLVGPATTRAVRFAEVRSQTLLTTRRQGLVFMVTLVRDGLV